jgi:hypothetical protein
MRFILRTSLVCLLVAVMIVPSALACHFCGGGGWGGRYSRGPVYYSSSYGGDCCGGYTVVHD